MAAANLSDAAAEAIISTSVAQIMDIISANNTGLASNCSKCVAALSVGQMAAKLAPSYLPDAMVKLCQTTGFGSNSTCQSTYEASAFGAIWTQVLAKADVAGLDGRYICSSLSTTFCSAPPVIPVKATFPKAKPADASVPVRSGKTVKVFHLSDIHLGKSEITLLLESPRTNTKAQIRDMSLAQRPTAQLAFAADQVLLY